VDWTSRGACLSAEPEQFFPVGTAGPSLREITTAKEICGRCPVIGECRDYAFETRQPFGIWGGMDEEERRAELARRDLVAVG